MWLTKRRHGRRNQSSLILACGSPNRATNEEAAMQETVGVDQKASDAELITLLRRAQEEIDAHGELNEVNLLLRDFARELLKKRLLIRVQFVQMMELGRSGQSART
jgi:hypothetical protein